MVEVINPLGVTASTQTLQQTVDLGNTVVNGSFKAGIFDAHNGYSAENTSTLDKTTLETTKITFTKNYFGLKTTNLFQAATPTVNRSIYFPDANGTIALVETLTTKTLKTVIPSAEVLNLFSTPKIILQNNNPLTIKLPVSIYVKKGAGTEYTMVGQLLEIKDSNSNQVNTLSSQFLTTTDGFAQCSFIFNNNSISSNKMGNYTINLQSSNPTIGTAPLEVYVVYNEITL